MRNQYWKVLKKIGFTLLLLVITDIFLALSYFNYTSYLLKKHPTYHKNYQTGLIFFHSIIDEKYELSKGSIHRLETALKLYQEGKIKQFIVAGGNRNKENYKFKNKPAGSVKMAQWLIHKGIEPNKITIDSCSYDTVTNIDNVLKLSKSHSFGSIMCISSTLHLFRIQYILQIQKINMGICPVGHEKRSIIEFMMNVHQEWAAFFLMTILDKEAYLKVVRNKRQVETIDCI